MTVRVRFAPSPTGYLHIGGARTALFNWLFARHNNGKFILRIEDTDLERSTEDSLQNILAAMRWLRLDWDEGPDVGGDFGPYRQSERSAIYNEYCSKLVEKGYAYRCFCTKEELEEKKQRALEQGLPPKYDGTCRSLSRDKIEEFERDCRPSCVRFHITQGETIVIDDIVRGRVEFNTDLLGDFIIKRSDGGISFNLANVIDDMLMEITHIVRGEDHLSNTPRHILLYRAFEAAPPQFAHLSMIMGQDRTRLSKRHGATSVTAFREMGYLPEALVNYLALLGWSPQDGEEIIPIDKLIKDFSLERVAKSAAVFDYGKLNHINNYNIKTQPIEKIVELAVPYFQQPIEKTKLTAMIELVRESVSLLSELPEQCRIFSETPLFEMPETKEIVESPEGKLVLTKFEEKLLSIDVLDKESIVALVKEIQKETNIKGKNLYMPLRVGLTGQLHGPDLVGVILALGKDECSKRLKNVNIR